jgi:hypothetical protein
MVNKETARRRVQRVWTALLLVPSCTSLLPLLFVDDTYGLIGTICVSVAVTGGFVASAYLVVQAVRYRLLGFRRLGDITFSFVILGSGAYLVVGVRILYALLFQIKT